MSNQAVSTPVEFLKAVEERFGPITFDLAANAANAVTRRWFGPGGIKADGLAMDAHWPLTGLNWLNPPFADIAHWARRAAAQRIGGARIALLGPAAVCTGWFVDWVAPHAYVFELSPRVFKTEIRDCILALYEPSGYVGREAWRWKK